MKRIVWQTLRFTWQGLKFIWQSAAAVVALVLIIIAFAIGIRFGLVLAPEAKPSTQASAGVTDEAKPTMYTCSMHPTIRLPNADDKCPICFMALIPVASGSSDEEGERELVMSEAALKLAEIQTTPVVRMFPTQTVRMFGNVDYDETRIATIAAYFPGRLERLFVDYTGVKVSEGDHLVDIYSPDLNTAHVELQQALDAVDQSREGSPTLRAITTAQLAATREKLRLWGLTEQQIAEMEQTEQPIERLTIYSPIDGVVITKTAVEGMYVKTGDEIYTVADLSHLWVQLEAYESQLMWIRYAQDVEFEIESMPGQTFSGRIAFIDPVVNLATRTVRIRLNVDNADGRLKPGMFVRAVAHSEIAGHGLVITDELAGKWIGPMHPEIVKDGPGECDICGMPLVPIEEVGYIAESSDIEPPMVIPATAPLITGKRAVVYVRVPDREKPTFEGREIVLGPRAGEQYIVLDGLVEGEEVVTNGAFKIDSAMQILAKPSMMDPIGTGATGGHQHGDMSRKPVPGAGATSQPEQMRFDLPTEFVQQLEPVYSAYFQLPESLAADDLAKFKQGVIDFHESLNSVDPADLTGEPLASWRRIEKQLRTDAEHIEHITEIAQARSLLETYFQAILDLEERFGHVGTATHYRTFCPMAFGDRGAFWMSREIEISNPYLGSAMPRCGEVKSELPPRELQDAEEGER